MEINPYTAAYETIERPKERTRSAFLTEILAIIFASIPAAVWLSIVVVAMVYPLRSRDVELFAETFKFAIGVTFLALCIITVFSGTYNLKGALNGRRTGYIGLFANLASIAPWFVSVVDAIKEL